MDKETAASTMFSHYRLIERIGAGGMGEVYLAEDTRLDRKVALKLLPAQFTQDAERVRRFMQEAKAASALNHPNIITIHDIGACEAGRFIVMELVAGRTLRTIIDETNSVESRNSKENLLNPIEILLTTGGQIAKALSAAHAAGITHRDIKPDNLMVRDDGYAKVLDFGLARLLPTASGEDAATLAQQTTPGMLMGTVAYMSPEQAQGQSVNPPSDLFALGIVFYELATGRHPFISETLVGYLHAITSKAPTPPSQWNPQVPAALDALIVRMLEKEANRRPTASEIACELQEMELQRRLTHMQPSESEVFPAGLSSDDGQPELNKTSTSLAVLPFVNISNDPDNEYFCDGLAEELLNALSKIEALRVAARTSAFSFKGRETDIREIGQKLDVSVVLEGSVRKSGNRLRITTQLVNVKDGYHLWSERYDREMKDIFDVQDEITLTVVDALKMKLLGVEKAAVLKRYTDNTEAYQLYLKGRYHANSFTRDGFDRAIEYLNQAIDKDPNYALAYLGIADAYYHAATVHVSPGEAFLKLKEACAAALEMDEELAEAHTFLAIFQSHYERKSSLAESGFKRGIELAPNNVLTHQQYGLYLAMMGRFDEAIAELKRAQGLDPLSLVNNFLLGWTYYFARQPEQAKKEARKALEINESYWMAHWTMALGYEQSGQYQEALAELEKAKALDDSSWIPAVIARVLAGAGRKEEAQKIVDELTEKSRQQWVAPYLVATAHVHLGDQNQALQWLAKAFEECDEWVNCINVDPAIDPIRSDSRFQDLVRSNFLG